MGFEAHPKLTAQNKGAEVPVPNFAAHADCGGTSPVTVMQNPAESNGTDPAPSHAIMHIYVPQGRRQNL